MTDAEVAAAKARLNAALPAASPTAGIRFGMNLYSALARQGQIVVRPFIPTGFSGPALMLPTYGDHYAFMDLDETVDGFTVGK